MKILFLSFVLSTLALAQAPDCTVQMHFTNVTGDSGNSYQTLYGFGPSNPFNNMVVGCTTWSFAFDSQGVTGLTIQLESSLNTNTAGVNAATGFMPFVGSTIYGINPNTYSTNGLYVCIGYFPWLRVNILTYNGTGSVNVTLFGWRASPYNLNGLKIL